MTRLGLKFKLPKTKRGRRKIALYPSTIETLRRHKARQAEQRLSRGLGRDKLDLICGRADGLPWTPSVFSKEFSRFANRCGFNIRFHDLRHGHVSHLLAARENPRMIADRVGHASAKMTLDIYAHTLPGEDKEACDRLDAILQEHMTKQ